MVCSVLFFAYSTFFVMRKRIQPVFCRNIAYLPGENQTMWLLYGEMSENVRIVHKNFRK